MADCAGEVILHGRIVAGREAEGLTLGRGTWFPTVLPVVTGRVRIRPGGSGRWLTGHRRWVCSAHGCAARVGQSGWCWRSGR